jgi:transcriptional regulator with XRE-family HTH domain
MVRATADDEAFADQFEQRTARRRVINHLVSLRAAMGLTQKDIAERMGCTQGRVSKLENSLDEAITVGDLRKYASALGLSTQFTLMPKETRAVDRVRFHAMQIQSTVDGLAGLTKNDPAIARGAAAFFGEAAFNLLLILQEAAGRLPSPPGSREEGVAVVGPDGMEALPPPPKRVHKRRRAEEPSPTS